MNEKIIQISACKINLLEKGSFLIDIGARIIMAYVFWSSGVLKVPADFIFFGQGFDWEVTVELFRSEHPVPFIPAEIAAPLGTTFEILCPILLVLGLGTRAAAFILLSMTAVIQFTYQSNIEHGFWAVILGYLLVRGPGLISIDHFIRKKFLDKA